MAAAVPAAAGGALLLRANLALLRGARPGALSAAGRAFRSAGGGSGGVGSGSIAARACAAGSSSSSSSSSSAGGGAAVGRGGLSAWWRRRWAQLGAHSAARDAAAAAATPSAATPLRPAALGSGGLLSSLGLGAAAALGAPSGVALSWVFFGGRM